MIILESEDTKEVDVELIINEKLFTHHYQPLYYLSNWSLCGYEALFRCRLCENPEIVFHAARKQKRIYDLDTASILLSALSYFSVKRDGNLFVNVFPSTLLHPAFFSFIDKLTNNLSISTRNIILEINESEEIEDAQQMRIVISFLRRLGFRIAFDDIGKGSATLKNIIEFEPDIIKLDRYFSMGLAGSDKKQKLIKMLVDFCQDDVQLVLEGLEKPEDLAIAKVLGIRIGQGYLLGRPQVLATI